MSTEPKFEPLQAGGLERNVSVQRRIMRPDFIPRGAFRAYLTFTQINKYARIGGMLPSSYIARCERNGRPLKQLTRQGSRLHRLIDVVARASAEGLPITPPDDVALVRDINALRLERDTLALEVEERRHILALRRVSASLTGATLLSEAEIAAGRMQIPSVSGVYFLLRGERVVYVGQAQEVFRRVLQHIGHFEFDSFAFVPCDPSALDVLESLYIHALRPEANGRQAGGKVPCAPIRLDVLLAR